VAPGEKKGRGRYQQFRRKVQEYDSGAETGLDWVKAFGPISALGKKGTNQGVM